MVIIKDGCRLVAVLFLDHFRLNLKISKLALATFS